MRVPTDNDFVLHKDIVPHWEGTISGLTEYHVMPEFDAKPHDWRFCKCNPEINAVVRQRSNWSGEDYYGTIYIHSPFDREIAFRSGTIDAVPGPHRIRNRGRRNPNSAIGIELNRIKEKLSDRLG